MGRIRHEGGKTSITFSETTKLPKDLNIGRISAVRAASGEIFVQTKEGEQLCILLGLNNPIQHLIRKGSFVGYEKRKTQGMGEVSITLDHLLYPKQVQMLKSKGLWPKEFGDDYDDGASDVDTDELSSSDSEDGDHPRARTSSQHSQKKSGSEHGDSKKTQDRDGSSSEKMEEHAEDEQPEDDVGQDQEAHEEEQDEDHEQEQEQEEEEEEIHPAEDYQDDYDPQEYE